MLSAVRARWVAGLLLTMVATAACGSGGNGDDNPVLKSEVRPDESGVIVTEVTRCEVRDGREMKASGTVRNTGEKPYTVQISVRFVDGDGTRVEISTDSVSDLEPRETARWDASTYSDAAPSARSCEVDAKGS